MAFLQPLFDTYAGPNRVRDIDNPLLHPTLADINTLPQNMLFIVGGADILRDETTSTTEKLETEAEAINQSRQVSKTTDTPDGSAIVVRTDVYEGQIHGWLESTIDHVLFFDREVLLTVNVVPSFAIDVNTRTKAFSDAIEFLRNVHQAYGFRSE